MLRIKLARFGKNKQPEYRIVVNEDREKRDGKYVALLGHYSPAQTPKILKIDAEAFTEWMKKGAEPTDTVAELFKRFQSGNPFPDRPARPSKKARAKAAAAAEEAAQAAAAPAEVAPVAEAPVAEAATTEEAPAA